MTEIKTKPRWREMLDHIFMELERRKTLAAQSQPISDADFRRFVQSVAIPAFSKFYIALKEHGDVPEFNEGPDWVGLRWQDGRTISVNALQRAPNRAATTLDRTLAARRQLGEPAISDITQMAETDVLHWLVVTYASYCRVSESEIQVGAKKPA